MPALVIQGRTDAVLSSRGVAGNAVREGRKNKT